MSFVALFWEMFVSIVCIKHNIHTDYKTGRAAGQMDDTVADVKVMDRLTICNIDLNI